LIDCPFNNTSIKRFPSYLKDKFSMDVVVQVFMYVIIRGFLVQHVPVFSGRGDLATSWGVIWRRIPVLNVWGSTRGGWEGKVIISKAGSKGFGEVCDLESNSRGSGIVGGDMLNGGGGKYLARLDQDPVA